MRVYLRLRHLEISRMSPSVVPMALFRGPKVSRLNDDEMKRLMIDVVDRAYRFIHTLFDDSTGGQLLVSLAERDPLPLWNKTTLVGTTPRPK